MIIVVGSNKEGVGKTTLASNLAVAFASRAQKVVLGDADPQETALYWGAMTPDVDRLTHALADRADRGSEQKSESTMRPITVSLPTWMIEEFENLSVKNKRSGSAERPVSALIRRAVIVSAVRTGNKDCEL